MRALRFDAGSLQRPRRTSQGYLRVDGWASRVGILEYRNPDGTVRRELREPDAVFDDTSLTGFEGAPITDDHPSEMVSVYNAKALTKGTVLSVGRKDGDHVAVSMVITDPDLIRKIESGKRQLSTGYYVELDETPGVHPQFGRYDARQVRVGPVNHLAVVERGRAGTASLRMDSADALVEVVPDEMVARIDEIERRIDVLSKKDEWDESAHPRAENGQFGEGGGTTAKEEAKTERDQTERDPKPAAEKPKKLPTFAKARETMLNGLEKAGWTVKKDLKVPHATTPDGQTRLWFKPQAIWHSKLGEGGGYDNSRHSLASAGSTFHDIREHVGSDEAITKFASRYHKAAKTDVAPDLHVAKPVPESSIMDLEAALARIKELEAKLDALEAAPADAPAEKKCPECGAMNPADATSCEKCGASLVAKTDAADVARLEGERDAARTDAEEAKKALSTKDEAHKAELDKVRKDADDTVSQKVREALDVLTKAVMVLGKDSKIKLDGKDVELIDAPLRAVKCAVIKHLKGKTVDAKKLDAYVDALFDDAIESFNPGAKSLAQAKAVVEDNGRKDAAEATAPAKDPEAAAAEAIKNRYATAWMAESNK